MVTPPATTSRGAWKPMCTCASMKPGISVRPVASTTSAPSGIAPGSGPLTRAIVRPSTTTVRPARATSSSPASTVAPVMIVVLLLGGGISLP
jgi:hypothetical protein